MIKFKIYHPQLIRINIYLYSILNMNTDLLNKCIFNLFNHNDRPIWNINNEETHIINANSNIQDIIKNHKEKIDKIPKNIWNNCKKLINDFESLNIINHHNINIGIANHVPISRAFFKMWEIINDFKLLDFSNNLIYGALCEGPGGFIEAFNVYRKHKFTNIKDTIVAITLKNDNDTLVPAWKKSQRVLKECSHIYITYGNDNTGNLYNVNNIEAYINLFKEYKADLVTGDGGFDFSPDYNNQEINIIRLLWCEIVTGILSLKKNGNMVIKIFDCFEKITIDILYILSYYFQNVYIVKPLTSRPLNSEKYMVCKSFMNNYTEDDKTNMLQIVNNMNSIKYKSLIKNSIPTEFIECINVINTGFAFRQIRYINKIFNIIEKKYQDLSIIFKEKIVYSIAWCKKYGFNINYKSSLLT